ncbi:hypothetical protein [Sphingomonas turrisvirgatae]|uniref:UrcA family protein n=1 Tax=Sphingomonas turrisvirgatae TaxID=1888892 RepID=A0A1E3LSG8_9SPHN|nr:hypothetical protein [Sphingomonas turrisvirgatae]ODP36679.1 hypothetical protein BFL28_05085 [Sphingomonas turrisvirgatae]
MFTVFAAGLGLIMAGAVAGEGLVHEAEVDHRGEAMTVRYLADPVVTLRDIGARTPNRPSAARCVWTARLDVRREVAGAAGTVAAFDKTFEGGETLEGSRPGSCMTLRRAITADAMTRLDSPGRLAAAAAADKTRLTAELDSVGSR